MKRISYLLALTLVVFSGCSVLWVTQAPENKQSSSNTPAVAPVSSPLPTSVPVTAPPSPLSSAPFSSADIELLWRATDNVDTYQVFYGTNKDNLDQRVELNAAALQRFTHPLYGDTYRYVLQGLPRENEIFVSISAKNNYGESRRSSIITVPPQNFAQGTDR